MEGIVEIRVYRGDDERSILYEDEKDNYNYEINKFSTIEFDWDNNKKIFTAENRISAFPSMVQRTHF